jgi:branched-chain amino acid transport system substrate-binding protein
VKKVLFLLFSCLLFVAMVLPACTGGGGPKGNVIKVGVIGPMQYLQGKNHWWGAELARDEINEAGGIKIGDKTYTIELIQADSNESNSITDATAAMEKLITVDKADFVIGGFRTEAVLPMQDVAMDNKKIFLDCGAADMLLCSKVKQDYDRYKYFFRVTPFVSALLADQVMQNLAVAQAVIREDTGVTRPFKAAVCTEGAKWADSITGILKNYAAKKLGVEIVGIWRPSPTATELTAEMSAMQAAGTDIIITCFSGSVGIPYGKSYGELKIPAASVGINVEAQSSPGYWKNTNGLGNYDTCTNAFAPNVQETALTKPFIDKFMARNNGEVPAYNAGTYDALYILKSALERAGAAAVKSDGTFDSDVIVASLEQTKQMGTVAIEFTFTGKDAKLGNPHDVNYGPGINTGIGTQWQNGVLQGTWPNSDYGASQTAAGYDPAWATVKYPGIVRWMTPPLLAAKLKAEGGGQPVAPPSGGQPAAPPAGETAAPPAGGAAVSFPASTYTNSKYGFSIQFPKDWAEDPAYLTKPNLVVCERVAAFVPVMYVSRFDATGTVDEAAIKDMLAKSSQGDPKVTSALKEVTLADGTKAITCDVKYLSATGYDCLGQAMVADKNGNRIFVGIHTVEAFAPYDAPTGKLFSEILNSLTFK